MLLFSTEFDQDQLSGIEYVGAFKVSQVCYVRSQLLHACLIHLGPIRAPSSSDNRESHFQLLEMGVSKGEEPPMVVDAMAVLDEEASCLPLKTMKSIFNL